MPGQAIHVNTASRQPKELLVVFFHSGPKNFKRLEVSSIETLIRNCPHPELVLHTMNRNRGKWEPVSRISIPCVHLPHLLEAFAAYYPTNADTRNLRVFRFEYAWEWARFLVQQTEGAIRIREEKQSKRVAGASFVLDGEVQIDAEWISDFCAFLSNFIAAHPQPRLVETS